MSDSPAVHPTSLAGLDNVTAIEGWPSSELRIEGNPALVDLGLRSLATISLSLGVFRNPALPNCEAHRLIAQNVGGSLGWTCVTENLADTCADELTGCAFFGVW